MADASRSATTTDPRTVMTISSSRWTVRAVLPLWICVISLAMIAIVLIASRFDALYATQASLVQLEPLHLNQHDNQ